MGKKHDLSSIIYLGQRISKSCLDFMDIMGKPRLKVALISYYYKKPTVSGVGIHVQNLAKYLSRHNCNVHVFCSGDEDEVYKEGNAVIHSIGKVLTPLDDKFSKKRLDYDLFESEVVKEIIRENGKHNFDIIHTHGALTKAAFIIQKVYGIKWIHTFHAIEKLRVRKLSDEEKQFGDLVSWIERSVNHCDGAIFVSKELLKKGERNYKLESKTVIPNGVDTGLFTNHPINGKIQKNVLFIGRFSKEKGIGLLLKMIPEILSMKDATFTMVCPYKKSKGELEGIRGLFRTQEEIFKERLKIIGQPQEQEVLRDLYRECRVYIQPSKYESFGLCILEAMATGRPVVAFKVGGMPEVIGGAGFLAKDPKELIYKVKRLLKDKRLCISLGKKAAMRAGNFDWDLIALKTIKYYGKVRK